MPLRIGDIVEAVNAPAAAEATHHEPAEPQPLAIVAELDQLKIDMAGLQARYRRLAISAQEDQGDLSHQLSVLKKAVESTGGIVEALGRRLKQVSGSHDNAVEIISSNCDETKSHADAIAILQQQVSAIAETTKAHAAQLIKLKKNRLTLTQIALFIICVATSGNLFLKLLDSADYGGRLNRIEQHMQIYP